MIQFGYQLQMRLEILAVAVPPGSRDLDERHTGLHEAAGNERLLTEERRAIGIENALGLARNIKQLFAGHQPANPRVSFVVAGQRSRLTAASKSRGEQIAQLGPLLVIELAEFT